jgi:hypothetical protein
MEKIVNTGKLIFKEGEFDVKLINFYGKIDGFIDENYYGRFVGLSRENQ